MNRLAVPVRALGRMLRLERDDRDFQRSGNVEISADRRQTLFNDHTRLADEGFTEVRRGYFVRPSTSEIFHVLHHSVGKHSTHLHWGVSLSFVPHGFESQIRFHRTLKSAQLDLSAGDGGPGACFLHGEPPFVRDLAAMWARSKGRASRFWSVGSSVEGVLTLADELLSTAPDKWGWTPDIATHPSPRFVKAFVLARLGRVDEAGSELLEWATRFAGEPRAAERLEGAQRALAQVAEPDHVEVE
jgi:hypothetical protein